MCQSTIVVLLQASHGLSSLHILPYSINQSSSHDFPTVGQATETPAGDSELPRLIMIQNLSDRAMNLVCGGFIRAGVRSGLARRWL